MKTNTIFFFVIWLSRNMKNLYSITVSWSLRKSTTRRPEKIASICSKLLRNIYDHVTADRMWPKKGTFIIRWNDDRWCLALTSPGFLAGEVEKWSSQGAPGRRKDRRHHTWPRIKKSRFWRFRWNLGWLFSHLVSHCVRKRNVIATIKLKLQFVAVEMLEQKQNV